MSSEHPQYACLICKVGVTSSKYKPCQFCVGQRGACLNVKDINGLLIHEHDRVVLIDQGELTGRIGYAHTTSDPHDSRPVRVRVNDRLDDDWKQMDWGSWAIPGSVAIVQPGVCEGCTTRDALISYFRTHIRELYETVLNTSELNMSNYDEDQVSALNETMVEVYAVLSNMVNDDVEQQRAIHGKDKG